MTPTTTLRRRSLLRGAGLGTGAALLAPMVRAATATAPRKRLVMFLMSNGLGPDTYRTDAMPAKSATGFEAPLTAVGPGLAPLAPLLGKVTIVEGMRNPFGQDLHGNMWASTSVAPCNGTDPGGVSIDRLVARELGSDSPFPSINLATVTPPDFMKAQAIHRSSDGPRAIFPPEQSPARAYAQLFGGGAGGAPLDAAASARLLARQRSVLDFVRADVTRASGALGASEQAKLAQYMDGLRGLERQLVALAGARGTCAAGAPPPDAPPPPWPTPDAHIEAHMSVAFNALACGITGVAAIAFSASDGGTSHYGLGGIPFTGSHHSYCHAGNREAISALFAYMFGKVAGLWQRLSQVPEAGGTMADNTLFLVVNDGGGSHHNGYDDIPMVLVGNAGGAFRTGRLISLPVTGKPGNTRGTRSTSDLFVSVLNALAIRQSTFGDPSACKGPLPQLAG